MYIQENFRQIASNPLVVLTGLLPICTISVVLFCSPVTGSFCILLSLQWPWRSLKYTLYALVERLTLSSSPLLQLGYNFFIFLLELASGMILKYDGSDFCWLLNIPSLYSFCASFGFILSRFFVVDIPWLLFIYSFYFIFIIT